jgi:hypothetical protein
MPHYIDVIALRVPDGFQGRHRAGRYFERGQPCRFEIVAGAYPNQPFDPPDSGRPSTTTISQAGAEALEADRAFETSREG